MSSDKSSSHSSRRSPPDCKFEKALQLAQARLYKDARTPALRLEHELFCRERQAFHEAKESSRQEWLDNFSIQRAEEYEECMNVIRSRRETAQSCIRSQQEQLLADAESKRLAEEEREAALAQLRDDEEALRKESADAKASKIASTLANEKALLHKRVNSHQKQQDDTAQRRANAEALLARERSESAQRRRLRDEAASARVRSASQQHQDHLRRKEESFNRKIQQIEDEKMRRQLIMEQIQMLNQERHQKVSQVKELAWQASVKNDDSFLRQELEALVPRLTSAPTSPRSTNVSFCSHLSIASTPRKTRPLSPRVVPCSKVQTPRAKASQIRRAIAGAYSQNSSSASFSTDGVAASPTGRKLAGGPACSTISLVSTRPSPQASCADLETTERVAGG